MEIVIGFDSAFLSFGYKKNGTKKNGEHPIKRKPDYPMVASLPIKRLEYTAGFGYSGK
jgi:hypothetical protein